MQLRNVEDFTDYQIDDSGNLYKNGVTVIVGKDGYFNINGSNRRLPYKMMLKAFPEKIPGVEIDGYPSYRITKDGQVFGMRNCRFSSINNQRRHSSEKFDKIIRLHNDDGKGRAHLVHRLVAKAYIPNPLELAEVNHKDGDPSNNNVDNLEWCSRVQNMKHASDNYLFTGSQKHVLMRRNVDDEPTEFISMQQAADTLGMQSRNANKNISETCSKNASDKLNRGKSNKTNPFKTEGYIFHYST